MWKKIALVAPLLFLGACGGETKKVTVENAEIVDIGGLDCQRRYCEYFLTVKKGDTTVKLRSSELTAKAATKGSKVKFTYNPESLETESLMFTDFDPKEENENDAK
ncbi:hypothetical protein BCB4_0099 [Bacillus phage B4]|uniref:Lipoprotein n=2 Tax=Bequatrovirus B4 TaxID=1918005 RepID=J9Q8X5_9CAUD|nr:hypothetical protein BCB4_0099 [Bacillus phage B4]YP_009783693.1 hypothetical protein QLX26_gp097 [Bacillus phage B5S]MEB9013954.1 hypothetical protein [Bacillus cereus]AEW47331.1 hypothetical protein B5S_0097 [Bacillus phage B5S]AEZ65892.1 hypothetical protein BCB4_0099 [Bacillus phage B4]MEB9190699.1 hypothetical protein [Bacillus cereus]